QMKWAGDSSRLAAITRDNTSVTHLTLVDPAALTAKDVYTIKFKADFTGPYEPMVSWTGDSSTILVTDADNATTGGGAKGLAYIVAVTPAGVAKKFSSPEGGVWYPAGAATQTGGTAATSLAVAAVASSLGATFPLNQPGLGTSIPTPPAVPAYTVKDVGTLGGVSTVARAISSSGKVTGSSKLANGKSHAFLFDGTMHDLGVLNYTSPGGVKDDQSVGNGLLDDGTVVGMSANGNSFGIPVIFKSRTVTEIGDPGVIAAGFHSQGAAYGISNTGVITGAYNPNNDYAGDFSKSFVFRGEATANMVGLRGGAGFAINGSNVVAGMGSTNFPLSFDAGGSLIVLDTGGAAFGVNAAGDLVGNIVRSTYTHAFKWANKTYATTDLGTLPGGSKSTAYGINKDGWIVGSSDSSSGQKAALYLVAGSGLATQVLVVDLNTAISAADKSKYNLTEAFGINDAGQIVCNTIQGKAVILTPTK
ncbi:MAG: hypothetical protein ABUL49_00200, partial [bacterium]